MLGSLYRLSDKLRARLRSRRWTLDQATGRRGEDLAHRFLQRAGFVIVARNYRIPAGSGEIDLVGWEDDKLVIVEVKTRRTDEYGPPDRAIGQDKKQSLLRAARDYARRADAPWDQVRFDVVNVLLTSPPAITHFRDVMSSF
ncbi:MAG: YraN family protein [Acidobacteriota bacterium]|nr:YraN family protein [Acidobacteriota bacterium]